MFAETIFAWNFAMDMLLCLAAARCMGRVRPGACALAALIGASYALLAQKFLAGWIGTLLVGALMAFVAVRPGDWREGLRASAALWSASLFCAGARLLIGPWGAMAGAGLFLWLASARKERLNSWDVLLFLRTGEGAVRFRALVDTGNRLKEPLSGLPVMIVEERVLKNALPPDFDAQSYAHRPPLGWRAAAYGVLGSAGRIACFKPDRLMVRCGERWLRAPDVWVGVYPGRIPGHACALAPAVLGRIEVGRGKSDAMSGRRAMG